MNELRLKALLRDWEISQAELAAGVGVSKATISLLLNKDHWPQKPEKAQLQADMEVWLWTRLAEDDVYPGPETRKELWMPAATGIHGGPDHTPEPNKDEGEQPKEPTKMLTHAEWLTDSAKRFFGLTRDPFKDDVETPEDVFLGAEHDYALASMRDALEGHRMVAVIGESGAGKTTIRRLFAERHRDAKKYALIVPYMLGNDDEGEDRKPLRAWDIQEAIISTLDPSGRVPRSRYARAKRVDEVLKRSVEAGRKNVIVIDQAHKVPSRTLVFLKELHDLELGMRRLTGVILIGQPELESKLDIRTQSGWAAREFIQRCEKASLRPLDMGGDLESYLEIKFKRIGKTPADVLESDVPDAIRQVLQIRAKNDEIVTSYVLPLTVNNLMAKALNFTARMGKPSRKVGGDQIRKAMEV
jgi:type II secretory pathway predicted ATPase ExeA